MKKILLAVIFLIIYNSVKADDFPVSGTIGSFLKVNKGTKSSGMADAYTSIRSGTESIYGNPACFSKETKNEISLKYVSLFEEVSLNSISFLTPFSFGNFGFSFSYLNYGSLEKRDENDVLSGSFSPYDLVGIISYARDITESISLGANLKGFSEIIEEYSFSSIVFDVGCLIDVGSLTGISDEEELFGGIVIQNVGMDAKGFRMPINIKSGLSYKLYGLLTEKPREVKTSVKGKMLKDTKKETEDVLISALNLDFPLNGKTGFSLGVEYLYQFIGFRVGYRLGGLTGLTLGTTIKIFDSEINYAFIPSGDLGLIHNISLNYNF
ncbi:MAG: PorV/PorQ family protein [Candidatus Firestonebacteria bacterium]